MLCTDPQHTIILMLSGCKFQGDAASALLCSNKWLKQCDNALGQPIAHFLSGV
jgi:hypothetical protein